MGDPLVVGSPHCGLRPDSVLGGEVYERMLLSRLPDHGVEIEIGLPGGRAVPERPGWTVTRLRPARGLRWWVAPLAFVPYTVGLLRRRRVDLLRGHSVRFVGPSLILARRLAGSQVPIVLHHLHTEPRWRRLEAAVLRRADAVITISERSRHDLVAAGVPVERIYVVPPGVSEPEKGPPWLEAWPPAGLRLLFLGRLIDSKGPDVAVEALARVVRREVDASLVMAGRGPLRKRLARAAGELGCEARIRWISDVSESDKWRLYAAADAVLFPSTLEGFGLVAAEAQAAGVPVIARAGTAVEEIVHDGETGFLVEDGAEAFAAAIERLAHPEVRGAMGQRAKESARRFDWKASAEAVAAVYAAVAGRSRAASAGRAKEG